MNENERPWVTDIKADGNVRFERVHNVGVDEANSWYVLVFELFFFVQAEDGIRDLTVTGVQTCALPICTNRRSRSTRACPAPFRGSRRPAQNIRKTTGRCRRTRSSRRTQRLAGSPVPQSAPPSVVAIFGPTGSGKTAVGEAVADLIGGEVVSADSMKAYRGLPILTAQPDRPTRLVGIWPLSHEGSVAEYARLAHAAVDELLAAGPAPRVCGGTGRFLRGAPAGVRAPPRPAP